MSLKIEDIQVGDELVCIDEDYYLKHLRFRLVKESKVSFVYDHSFKINDCLFLSCDLKYFKKKEQSQYTFDDLIDVANDAVKNKLITQTRFSLSAIGTPLLIVVYFDGREGRYTDDNLLNGIEFIKSLYKETFVIEHASDLKKIKRNSIIKLENGNEVCAESDCLNNGVNYIETTYGGNVFNLSFIALRGATVEQSIGGV